MPPAMTWLFFSSVSQRMIASCSVVLSISIGGRTPLRLCECDPVTELQKFISLFNLINLCTGNEDPSDGLF